MVQFWVYFTDRLAWLGESITGFLTSLEHYVGLQLWASSHSPVLVADRVHQLVIKPMWATYDKVCEGSIKSPSGIVTTFTKEAGQNYESHKALVSNVTEHVSAKLQGAKTDLSCAKLRVSSDHEECVRYCGRSFESFLAQLNNFLTDRLTCGLIIAQLVFLACAVYGGEISWNRLLNCWALVVLSRFFWGVFMVVLAYPTLYSEQTLLHGMLGGTPSLTWVCLYLILALVSTCVYLRKPFGTGLRLLISAIRERGLSPAKTFSFSDLELVFIASLLGFFLAFHLPPMDLVCSTFLVLVATISIL